MDTHYVCTGGCKGVSPVPGTCQADSCPMHEHPLKECHCADGMHGGLVTSCTDCGTLCKMDGPGCAIDVQKPELTN